MPGVVAQRLLVRGRVQGVGYRNAAVDAALDLDVVGWVRNRRDGTVEALAQGETDAVAAFVAWCRRGPPLARVTAVEFAVVATDDALVAFEWRVTA